MTDWVGRTTEIRPDTRKFSFGIAPLESALLITAEIRPHTWSFSFCSAPLESA